MTIRVKKYIGLLCAEILTLLYTLPCVAQTVDAQSVPDSVFFHNSRPVIFPVNRTVLSPEDEQWITDSLKPALDALGPHGYVLARASASPEGPSDNNLRLANGRRDAANNVLRRLGFDIERLRYNIVPEDYGMLLVLLQMRHDSDYNTLDSLVSTYSYSPAILKQQLKTYNGGRLWTRLLKDYFPLLRATRMMLVDKRVYADYIPHLPLTEKEITGNYCPIDMGYELLPFTDVPVHRIPLLNLRSNLLYDGFYMPRFGWAPLLNIGLEFYPRRGHFTYNAWFATAYYNKWKKHKFFQIRNYELEARFYFRGTDRADYHGWFLSLSIDNNIYGIGLGKRDGWEGEGLGGQFNLGYVLPLCEHKQWKLQFVAGVGYYSTRYDPYLYGVPDFFGHHEDGQYYYDTNLYRDDFKRRQHRFNWFGPTQVAINLSYDLLWRKHTNQLLRNGGRPPRHSGNHHRGISFRRWETKQ